MNDTQRAKLMRGEKLIVFLSDHAADLAEVANVAPINTALQTKLDENNANDIEATKDTSGITETKITDSQETNALAINTEAAKEIARQLRLRDLGGIIIVDFIDMKNPDNRKILWETMDEKMKMDRARHSVLPISKIGLMQITRQRLRPEINISTSENCPSCEGTGKVRSSQILIDDIEKHIQYIVKNTAHKVILKVHPILYSHFTKGFFFQSIYSKWKRKYGTFLIEAEPRYEFLTYRFFDAHTTEEIRI